MNFHYIRIFCNALKTPNTEFPGYIIEAKGAFKFDMNTILKSWSETCFMVEHTPGYDLRKQISVMHVI